MSIVDWIPISVDSKGSAAKGRIGTTIREEYRMVSDSDADDGAAVLNHIATELGYNLGDYHTSSSNALLKSISAKRTGSDKQAGGPFVWHVTLEYAPSDEIDDKHTDRCKISVSTETNDETDGRYDRKYVLNVNSAGDFFEDKLPLKNAMLVFRYELDYAPGDNPNRNLMDVFLHTNSDVWHTLPAGTCLVRSISTTRQYDDQLEKYYWHAAIEIAYNPNGWKYKKADCGFYDNNGRILDDQGAPVEKAQLLDGSGYRNYTGNPVMREFDLYNEVAFSGMSLPSPF